MRNPDLDQRRRAYSGKPNPQAWMSQTMRDLCGEYSQSTHPDRSRSCRRLRRQCQGLFRQDQRRIQPMRDAIVALPETSAAGHERGRVLLSRARFWLKELFLWPVNADSQGTPQQVRCVIDAMRANDVHVISAKAPSLPIRQSRWGEGNGRCLWRRALCGFSERGRRSSADLYLDLLRTTTSTIVKGLRQYEGSKGSAAKARTVNLGQMDRTPRMTRRV